MTGCAGVEYTPITEVPPDVEDTPEIVWEEKAIKVELNGDGQMDSARLGRSPGKVYVGAKVSGHSEEDVTDFYVGPGIHNAICSEPALLEIEELSNPVEQIGYLEGLKKINGAQGLRLSGGECDSVRLYWNHDQGQMNWWRR